MSAVREKKEILRADLVRFQSEIARMNQRLAGLEEERRAGELEILTGLFEVLDALESMEGTLAGKAEELGKTGRRLFMNGRAIQAKIHGLMESRGIGRLEFPDRRAEMETCKVIETRRDPDRPDETILSILRQGYRDEREGRVLRKAEVVTVKNPEPGGRQPQ